MTDSSQTDAEKRFSKKVLEEEYKRKYTYIKTGKIALSNKNFVEATSYFLKFLSIISEVHGANNSFAIKPNMFNGPAKTLERFMISNVYWELAKIYAMSPRMDKDLQKALNQFSLFTINQPFQVVNSETIRKHLKKNKIINGRAHFESCQKSIYVKSKKCFIATSLYGEAHPFTTEFRLFKSLFLNKSPLGRYFIKNYYFVSPRLVYYLNQENNVASKMLDFILKRTLHILYPVIRVFNRLK